MPSLHKDSLYNWVFLVVVKHINERKKRNHVCSEDFGQHDNNDVLLCADQENFSG